MSSHDEHSLYDEKELAEIFLRAHNEWLIIKYGYHNVDQMRTVALAALPENISECVNCGVGYLIIKDEPCAFCALLSRKRVKK